jgi:hypothetical protein
MAQTGALKIKYLNTKFFKNLFGSISHFESFSMAEKHGQHDPLSPNDFDGKRQTAL